MSCALNNVILEPRASHYVIPEAAKRLSGIQRMLYAVYILASQRNGTLYVGVTNELLRRIWEHKEKFVEGFTKQYAVDKLVYYEVHENIVSAIQREKQLKRWYRKWKLALIESQNPEWRDLYFDLLDPGSPPPDGGVARDDS